MYTMENPIDMDDLGVPHFRKPPNSCFQTNFFALPALEKP